MIYKKKLLNQLNLGLIDIKDCTEWNSIGAIELLQYFASSSRKFCFHETKMITIFSRQETQNYVKNPDK